MDQGFFHFLNVSLKAGQSRKEKLRQASLLLTESPTFGSAECSGCERSTTVRTRRIYLVRELDVGDSLGRSSLVPLNWWGPVFRPRSHLVVLGLGRMNSAGVESICRRRWDVSGQIASTG